VLKVAHQDQLECPNVGVGWIIVKCDGHVVYHHEYSDGPPLQQIKSR
jgi:hypothetical protein